MEIASRQYYEIISCLGHGNFGYVYHARNQSFCQEVAIKQIALSSLTPQLEEMLKREIDTLRTLNSPYIVKLVDVQTHGDSLWLIMEFCKGSNLESYCARLRQPVKEELVRKWTLQIATGMKEMRDKHIIHRDLKLANIMLSSPDLETAEIKICDFGFARFITDREMSYTVLGTPISTAPEVLEGKPYNHKADFWSLGVLLYELLTGKKPFPARTLYELQSMQKQPINFRNTEISVCAKALLLDLLRFDPEQRPEISEVLAHPFLNQSEPEILDLDQGAIDISPYYIELTKEHYEQLVEKYSKTDKQVFQALLESYFLWIEANVKKASLCPERKYLSTSKEECEAKQREIQAKLNLLSASCVINPAAIYTEAERMLMNAIQSRKGNSLDFNLEDVKLLLEMCDDKQPKVEAAKRLCWQLR